MSDPDGEIEVSEEELQGIPFENVHITQDMRETFVSGLTGRTYGPFLQCNVVRMPKDVVDFIREKRVQVELKRTEIQRQFPLPPKIEEIPVEISPIEPAPFLSPEDVNKLWITWASIVARGIKEDPEATRTEFLKHIDASKDLDANRRIIEFEAQKFIEPLIVRPFVPIAKAAPERLPASVQRVIRAALPGMEEDTQLLVRFPEDFDRYLRDEVGVSRQDYGFFSSTEQKEVRKFFREYLRRQRRIP